MPRSLIAAATNSVRNLRYNYLFLPGLIALALALAAAGLVRLDRAGGAQGIVTLFSAGPPAARSTLSTIATAVATVAGVSFSITILSLQLVSQQFTPRALRGFLGDRLNQTIAGIFIGTFLFSIVTLRAVEEDPNRFVPGLSVGVAVLLAFTSLALLLVFVHHMGHAIQVSRIAQGIAHATYESAVRLYPGSYGAGRDDEDADELVRSWEGSGEPLLVHPEGPGFVQSIDDIPGTIAGEGFRIELLVAPGDFVTPRHPLARVWTTADPDACAKALRRAVSTDAERDLQQDVGYGLRQLADIAVKALSPSINDPTTATTCIGYMQSVLERLAAAERPARVRRFDEQDVTIVMPRDSFGDYLEPLVQIGRYATKDARAVDALLAAAQRVAEAAEQVGASAEARDAAAVAERIARRALRSEDIDEEERARIEERLDAVPPRLAGGV